ncbi:hypothetical protein [Krasilnikovia sp. M28-CT-15]|uniref:hypothetical protein n=1 Tax=Krasilnikovia sp. M28-CT-15 TaxID=3373540 RepID=UPI0038770477
MNRRKGYLLAVVAVAVLLLAYGGYSARSNPKPEVDGSYQVSAAEDSPADFQSVWTSMHPEDPGTAPQGTLLVRTSWAAQGLGNHRLEGCYFHIVQVFPRGNQVTGIVPNGFTLGENGAIAKQIRQEYPAMNNVVDDSGNPAFHGAIAAIAASSSQPPLIVTVSPNVGVTLAPDQIRVGLAFSCDGRLLSFQWFSMTND